MNMIFRVVMISGLVMASTSVFAMEDVLSVFEDHAQASTASGNSQPVPQVVTEQPAVQPAQPSAANPVNAQASGQPTQPVKNDTKWSDIRAFARHCAQAGMGTHAAFWYGINGVGAMRKAIWTPSFTNKANWRKRAYRFAMISALSATAGYFIKKKYGHVIAKKYASLKRSIMRKFAQKKHVELA